MAQMPNPQRVPMVDPRGFMTREWVRYFSELDGSAGDAAGESGTTTIVNETNVFQVVDEEAPLPLNADALTPLRAELEAMQQMPRVPGHEALQPLARALAALEQAPNSAAELQAQLKRLADEIDALKQGTTP